MRFRGLSRLAWATLNQRVFDGDLPSDIAQRYRSSREAAAEAAEAITKTDKFMAEVSAALTKHGVTREWLVQVLEGLDHLSDDVALVLSQQGEQGQSLEEVRNLVAALMVKKPARIVLRPDRVEYVDYLTLGGAFLPGTDLIPRAGTVSRDHPIGRHVPAGFLTSC